MKFRIISMETSEKRRHIRRNIATHAWLQRQTEAAPFSMRSLDLALEGARFSSIRPVPEGEPLQVCILLESNMPVIECKGKVCWCRLTENGLHEFGVRFVDLREDERDRLDAFLIRTQARPALAVV